MFLFHRRSVVSVKTMPLAALTLPRPLQMLWSRSNLIRRIPSHPPSLLIFNRSRMSCVVPTVETTSLVSDTLPPFSTMTVFCPSSAATLRQVCTPAPCRIFCEIWVAIHMFNCTVLARFGRNCQILLHRSPHLSHPQNQRHRHHGLRHIVVE